MRFQVRKSRGTEHKDELVYVYKEEGNIQSEGKKCIGYYVCIGCIIAGTVITVLGLVAAYGDLPDATWEIMGSTIAPLVWGLPFAIFGIILLLIGLSITYYSNKK